MNGCESHLAMYLGSTQSIGIACYLSITKALGALGRKERDKFARNEYEVDLLSEVSWVHHVERSKRKIRFCLCKVVDALIFTLREELSNAGTWGSGDLHAYLRYVPTSTPHWLN